MKKTIVITSLIWMIAATALPVTAKTTGVLFKGVDDGIKHSKQQDYREAVVDAKLQAIKSAGLEIKSIVNIDDFETKFEKVESKAETILLPDFQILDRGYQTDVTYQVVLSGQVKTDDKEKTPFDLRIERENESYTNPFSLTPHRQNYLMPLTYNTSPNNEPIEKVDEDYVRTEIKFQLSFKFRILRKIFKDKGDIFFAYTQKSFWQAYDFDNSSPFRETNYEPELMLTFLNNYDLYGVKNRMVAMGFSHQSNGQAGTISRSWNRVYASFLFEKGNFYLGLKPWYRIPEKEENDDNPNTEKYFGYGEMTAMYYLNKHALSLMARNNFRSENRGAIQLGWGFPLNDKLKGYVQFFNGYGESLIDYDHSVNRFGIGIIISDWL